MCAARVLVLCSSKPALRTRRLLFTNALCILCAATLHTGGTCAHTYLQVGRPLAAGGSTAAAGVMGRSADGGQGRQREQLQEEEEEGLRYEAARHALFFSDPGAREAYRRHTAAILMRRNTLTGWVARGRSPRGGKGVSCCMHAGGGATRVRHAETIACRAALMQLQQ